MTGVPDPAMIVSGGDDYATIMATPAGVKFSEKFKGPPGEYRRWGPVIRWYNSDGRALVDIHHQDNHPDVGNPHIHEWDWETGQDPIKGEAKALPEWYGEAGMEDDGLPIHTPFPRGVVPQFLPAPKYQPRPIFAPDPAAKPLPVRPTAPLRLPFPTLRPVLP